MTSNLPARIPRVSAYISTSLKTDLERLATLERRSISQMVSLLIEEGIERAKEDGRLPPENKRE